MADESCRKRKVEELEKSELKNDEPPPKITPKEEHTPPSSFDGFELVKTISDNPQTKTVVLHGKYRNEDAVIVLEKKPFPSSTLSEVFTKKTKLNLEFNNDIYSQYSALLPEELSAVKTTLICPATQKHLDKYTKQIMYLVQETPEDYKKITVPHLEKQVFSIQWVYNILEKKAESERIVFEDPDPETGFILLPDLKWDGKQLENLYLVGICHLHGIKSLRDLRGSHLPLLKNMLKKGQEAIAEKYGVATTRLRVYIHYQPSYYHFHVHFTHLQYMAPGINVGRAHLLEDVIDNMENIDQDYYAKKTLTFMLASNDKLLKSFVEADAKKIMCTDL